MQRHLKQTFLIFLIFFLGWPGWQQAYAQQFIQAVQDIPLHRNGTALPMPWGGGLNAALLQMADLSGNGREELISLDRSSQSMMVFVWQEEQWQPQPELLCLLPAGISNWFIMIDYDGDGLKDIFTFTAAGIRVFRNGAQAGQPATFSLVTETINYESNGRQVNLLVNSSDVPAIADVDGDGDLDILAYDPAGGGGLHYYRNMSMEKTGAPGTSLYIRETRRWGGLGECECGVFAYNEENCDNKRTGSRVEHAGGKSLLLLDVDGDGDLDLLNGFEECGELYVLENTGTNTAPRFTGYRTQLPGSAAGVKMGYPAAFLLDADQNGRQDLVVSSQMGRNSSQQHDFSQSIWWYHLTEAEGRLAYSLQTKAFLQEDMLDAGENSIPAFMDIDADGDYDLLLGSYGLPQEGGFYAGLQLYENRGTASEPVFYLADDDFLQLKAQRFIGLQPQFVDFNGNGSLDLLLVATETTRFQRKAYVYLNSATSRAIAEFSTTASLELPITFSTLDNPFFYDFNRNGLPDLIVGRFDGSLSYYPNEGTAEAPAFGEEVKDFLGIGLDNFRRNLVPSVTDFTGNGQADLLLGDATGSIRLVENILAKTKETVDFETLVLCESSNNQVSPFGRRSWPTAVALRRPGGPLLVTGNVQGGLWLFETSGSTVEPEDPLQLRLFPNPASVFAGRAYLRSNVDARVRLMSIRGQVLQVLQVEARQTVPVTLEGISPGMYLLQAESAAGRRSAKLIVIE